MTVDEVFGFTRRETIEPVQTCARPPRDQTKVAEVGETGGQRSSKDGGDPNTANDRGPIRVEAVCTLGVTHIAVTDLGAYGPFR